MKKHLMLSRIFAVVLIILEAIPEGAVLIFKTPDGEGKRVLFSYFDPTVYGYANFGPFLTAILTSVIAVLLIVLFFKDLKLIRNASAVVSALAFLTSLMPLSFGFAYFTAIGFCISVILLCESILLFIYARNFEV